MADWLRCVESGANYEAELSPPIQGRAYRWFRARAPDSRRREDRQWYGTCSDIHAANCWNNDSRQRHRTGKDGRSGQRKICGVCPSGHDDAGPGATPPARDLHDGLGQELAVARWYWTKWSCRNPRAGGSGNEASSIVDRAIQQVRTMSHLLHPPLLDEVGLSRRLWSVKDSQSGAELRRLSRSSPAIFRDSRRT